MYRLAAAQENRGLIEAAEATLLDARHHQPEAAEPNRQLAQFYARRVTALQTREREATAEASSAPGEPDANGVYRIGASLNPPLREGTPRHPAEAQDAGIKGVVSAEILIDPAGNVTDARVVRSIPMLDDGTRRRSEMEIRANARERATRSRPHDGRRELRTLTGREQIN